MSFVELAMLLNSEASVSPSEQARFFPVLSERHDDKRNALTIASKCFSECLTSDMLDENDYLTSEATAVLLRLEYLYDEFSLEWKCRADTSEPWLNLAAREASYGNKPQQIRQYPQLFILKYWAARAAYDCLTVNDEAVEQICLALARRIATHCERLDNNEHAAQHKANEKNAKQSAGGIKSGKARLEKAKPKAPKPRPNNDAAILVARNRIMSANPTMSLKNIKSKIVEQVTNPKTGNLVSWQTVSRVLKKAATVADF